MSKHIVYTGSVRDAFGEILKKSVLNGAQTCKNCGHEIFWTEYNRAWAHRKYHDDLCKNAEPA